MGIPQWMHGWRINLSRELPNQYEESSTTHSWLLGLHRSYLPRRCRPSCRNFQQAQQSAYQKLWWRTWTSFQEYFKEPKSHPTSRKQHHEPRKHGCLKSLALLASFVFLTSLFTGWPVCVCISNSYVRLHYPCNSIVHECSKTHGAVEPLNKSLILKTQRLLNGGSSLHGSTQFETIFCFALNKKKPCKVMRAKNLFLDTLKIM